MSAILLVTVRFIFAHCCILISGQGIEPLYHIILTSFPSSVVVMLSKLIE